MASAAFPLVFAALFALLPRSSMAASILQATTHNSLRRHVKVVKRCAAPVINDCGATANTLAYNSCQSGNRNTQNSYNNCVSSNSRLEEEGEGLSGGAKAGVAIGVILAVALIAAGIAYYLRQKKRQASLAAQHEASMFGGAAPVGSMMDDKLAYATMGSNAPAALPYEGASQQVVMHTPTVGYSVMQQPQTVAVAEPVTAYSMPNQPSMAPMSTPSVAHGNPTASVVPHTGGWTVS